jgi:hypothetical protein
MIPVYEPPRRLLKVFGLREHGHSTTDTGLTAKANSDLSRPGDTDSYTYPRCGAQDLTRIPRRLVDRILAIFTGVRRFRCTHIDCLWEGNLRKKKPSLRRFEP